MNNLGEKKKENKLILFLSTCKPTAGNNSYMYENINDEGILEYGDIEGVQTPDAPNKYFLKCIGDKKIDEIICVTSKDANEKLYRDIKGKITLKSDYKYEEEKKECTASAYEEYKIMIEEFCKEENIEVPKITKLNFDYDFDNEEEIEYVQRNKKLCENIVNRVGEGDTIYIDYTNGMRDTSLLIILIIKYLEYKGVNFGGMIYSLFDSQNGCKIIDLESTYGLFELLKGVNEFTSFGKSKTLSNYYESIKNIENIEHKDKIKNLIDIMNEFSEMMNLCMLDEIDTIIEKLNNSILDIKSIDKNNNNELVNYMLFNLIDEIERKFYLDKKGEKITYMKLIKWCLDNELIQQALTLYVEKMPSLYAKFIDFKETSLSTTIKMNTNINQNNITEVFYSSLFSNLKFEYDKNNKRFPHRNYNSKDYTYYRNIKIIEALKNNKINVKWLKNGLTVSELELILREYFIFKIFRNQINHAKKSKLIAEVDQVLKKYKNKDGSRMYDVKNMNVDNIKNMMMNSIERIEPIVNR